MIIILRSHTGLSTIYHRIMFGMSAADFISSVSIAFTSLPMPKEMPLEKEFGYHWVGTRLGNTATCSAQGFLSNFGLGATVTYNSALCLYYGCTVALTMREDKVKKFIEPFLHIWPIAMGLSMAIYPLFFDLYNPAITTFAWCSFLPYPEECAAYGDIECVRGNGEAFMLFKLLVMAFMIVDFLIVVVMMVMVIIKAIQTNHILKLMYKNLQQRNDTPMWHQQVEFRQQAMLRQNNTNATVVHALSYIFALMIVLSLPLLLLAGAIPHDGSWQRRVRVDKAMLFFMPLQGFFNFFIFVSLKIYTYRRVHHGSSICATLMKVLFGKNPEPCVISRISIVNDDRNDNTARNAMPNEVDIDLTHNKSKDGAKEKIFLFNMSDESGFNELQYRIKLFTSNGRNQSVASVTDMHHDANNKDKNIDPLTGDIFMDHSHSMESGISYNRKSEKSIDEVEQSKQSKNEAFSQYNEQENSSHLFSEADSSVDNHDVISGESDAIEYEVDSHAAESMHRVSFSVKSENSINAEEQRKNEIFKLFNQRL